MNLCRILCVAFLLLMSCPFAVSASEGPYSRSYRYYLELAENALAEGNRKEALFYFESAHAIAPEEKLPLNYLNLLKRSREGLVENTRDLPHASSPAVARFPKTPTPHSVRNIPEQKKTEVSKSRSQPSSEIIPLQPMTPTEYEPLANNTRSGAMSPENTLELNDSLWQRQPGMAVDLVLNKPILFRGENIDRYLSLTENILTIERVDRNTLKILAIKRGSTFFHIWDDKGRWTFNVRGIMEIRESTRSKILEEQLLEAHEDPFRVFYNNNWISFYEGDSLSEMHRQNLSFTQSTGINGPTPYGKFDTSVDFYKFDDANKVIGQRIGLTDGKIGPFKDFTIRGYDTTVEFSPLSVPSRSFRGGLLDAYAFDRNVRYKIFQGQDRASFLFLAPGLFDVRKAYIEGAKITALPDGDHQYSFNYARGHGPARETFLKDKVYSVDTRHKFDDLLVTSEVAHDTDVYSGLLNSYWKGDNSSLRVNFRNIDKDFYPITGRPIAQGEIGGNVAHEWSSDIYRLSSGIDVYQDRQQANPNNPNEFDYDVNSSFGVRLSDTSNWNTSVYYTDTPQLISPRKNLRLNNRYSKSFRFLNERSGSFYIGNSYQRSRFLQSLSSEYDRYSSLAGFRLPFFKRLSYYLSYEYSWVKEVGSGAMTSPNVVETGFDYSRELLHNFYGNFNINYRDEEQSEGNFSFLSGEDSLRGSVSLTYRPSNDLEFFMDGSARNVWTENPAQKAFNDAEVRLGMRSNWNLPFRWDPTATISGKVYKDMNGNAVNDAQEPGVPGIQVKVGKKVLTTNKQGYYETKVSAKKIRVGVVPDSIPQGFMASTPLSTDIVIEAKKTYSINFGLSTHSGIYGVVYVDANGNGRLDASDTLIPKVKITLDNDNTTATSYDGAYFFNNIGAGKHLIRLEINSLPLDYLPTIPVVNKIDVAEGATYVFHIPVQKRP